MRMRAVDAFHTSETGTVQAGQEFDVHAVLGKEFERRGLAEVINAGSEEEPVVKGEPAPPNKMEPAAPNKRGAGRPKKAEPVIEPAPVVSAATLEDGDAVPQ